LSLTIEKLTDISFVPVCSPKLIKLHGRSTRPQTLACMPLIHDDMLADRPHVPTWTDWFKAAGVNRPDVSRGLRFNSPDHALQAPAKARACCSPNMFWPVTICAAAGS
jgi:LysR family transcriptional regulator, glycine cleavage system transcriptional activator